MRDRDDWDRQRRDFDRGDYDYEQRERERYRERYREDLRHPDHDRSAVGRSYDDQRTDWRTERQEGPNVVDRVKDWWNRNVAENERDPRDADRNWNRPREHFGDRDRWDTTTRDYNRNEGAGYTAYSYGGALGNAAERERQTRSYAGRGPKSWRRSDERIREDVNEELTRHPDVDASEVEVAVMNAEVTLTGTVGDRHEKRAAEDCAWRVSGVKDVHTQLRIRQGVGSMIADVFKGEERR